MDGLSNPIGKRHRSAGSPARARVEHLGRRSQVKVMLDTRRCTVNIGLSTCLMRIVGTHLRWNVSRLRRGMSFLFRNCNPGRVEAYARHVGALISPHFRSAVVRGVTPGGARQRCVSGEHGWRIARARPARLRFERRRRLEYLRYWFSRNRRRISFRNDFRRRLQFACRPTAGRAFERWEDCHNGSVEIAATVAAWRGGPSEIATTDAVTRRRKNPRRRGRGKCTCVSSSASSSLF